MTTTEVPVAGDVTAPVPVAGPGRAERLRGARRRAVGTAFVALVVLVVSIVIVNGPLADVWYSFRQEHLSSQFANPGTPKGGSALAVLQIPSRSINLIVLQGDGVGTLRAGPGHQPTSPLPGERGNSVIFGHRSSWGGPFARLDSVRRGDSLFLDRRTVNGDLEPLYFVVVSAARRAASDRRPYAESTDHRLTLVTAADGGQRFVVQAVSGPVGRLRSPTPATSASTGEAAGAVGQGLVWLAVCLAVGGLVLLLGRRRHRGQVLAVAVVPFALGALLSLILAGDAVLQAALG